MFQSVVGPTLHPVDTYLSETCPPFSRDQERAAQHSFHTGLISAAHCDCVAPPGQVQSAQMCSAQGFAV